MEYAILIIFVGGAVFLWRKRQEEKLLHRQKQVSKIVAETFWAARLILDDLGDGDRFEALRSFLTGENIDTILYNIGWNGTSPNATPYEQMDAHWAISYRVARMLINRFYENEAEQEALSYSTLSKLENAPSAEEQISDRKKHFAALTRIRANDLLKHINMADFEHRHSFAVWESKLEPRLEEMWGHYKRTAIENKGDNSTYLAARDLVRKFLSDRQPTKPTPEESAESSKVGG